jgi:light-regulated signal transduction histidine kinase (bacteriophytochrome)
MVWEDYHHMLDDEGKRLFTRIEDNAKKMGSLIDDLLEFSRMGRKEIQKSKVDMTALAESSLSEISSSVDHHADVKIHNLHDANADPVMLKQVMINLLSNAIKYSSKKENPVIEIKSHVEDDEIIYTVTDNGVGFNNEYVGKLFGVFQRLHLQSEFEGTGVGLALVKRIINKHGGRIWAAGEINKGATFSFSLPILTINQTLKNGQFAS